MDNDTPQNSSKLNVVSAASRFGNANAELVQMKPQLPLRTALMEASSIMGCITEITRKAIDRPGDRKAMMQATFYLAGMAKALIDGQLLQMRQAREGEGDA
ncbi:DUF3077 domain-containing protein [Pseudomonas monteilii]|uniref:DUF3077 domain-containing protein n=2 Tax=Pseudomonas TaxID=286 RepID=A0A6G6V0Z5_9PSED|nr:MULTISPECIES: DUF3077 domain-containing protein [Pseudomonas]AVH38278.1 DUF3077 domain-containing protein [Pseudomonas monteilii]MBA6136693.1 DUF3077 domain-containing protein [Pseudomonas monteilii]MBI6922374.1 DUF3077 domain-containing protein [Pseudomonas monteilii]MBV4513944.1 DUF3077 domain-containing protein [Pseudomonas kurunegalensis]MBZ3663944.1 DUF3077 domain-containing protein [Pseudomonas monteilii]